MVNKLRMNEDYTVNSRELHVELCFFTVLVTMLRIAENSHHTHSALKRGLLGVLLTSLPRFGPRTIFISLGTKNNSINMCKLINCEFT